uniref:GDSL esterase/lipase At5g33370-like n=1 Tax=Erigeron canadensis TaxID=72917 RepID=UPI001CB88AE1|nr:GDSL esterase/lipase At5g33370-like [Erigeron canadensis]
MASTAQKLLFFVLYAVVNGVTLMKVMAETEYKTNSPIFIFGDSTADVGTNNYLNKCTARADHRYHGIDFAYSKPTGRFSNGKNTADQIVRLLGNHQLSPPPYFALLSHKQTLQRNLLRGSNFASAGAGLFSETGQIQFIKVICMEEQIQQLAAVRRAITDLLGSPKTVDNLFHNSLFIISVGSNDLVEYTVSHGGIIEHPKDLIANLTQAYSRHLTNLYNLGARKFGIIGIPPIGCCPASRVFNTTGGCFEVMNDIARSFYKSMETLLVDFSFLYKGFKYSLGNTYAMTMNIIDNPRGNNFKEVKTACCGSGKFNGAGECKEGANLCFNRDDFLFWDWFHPTEKASELAALTLAYAEGTEYVTPMNFSSLAIA